MSNAKLCNDLAVENSILNYGEEKLHAVMDFTNGFAEAETHFKQSVSEAVHSLSKVNFDQEFATSKKKILEHLLKELGL